MLMEEYQDRFLAETYSDDEPVCFGIKQRGKDVEWLADMPESLFHRCQSLARAYSLHLLPSINYYQRTRLSKAQCHRLVEELEFIQSVVKDSLLEKYLTEFKACILRCARLPFDVEAIIEGP
jgi:hypothetical protein